MKIARAWCTLDPVGHVQNVRNQSRHNHLEVSDDEGSRQRLRPLKQRENHRRGEGHNAVPF